MNKFWQGETYAIVKAIKARGNQPGLVQEWKDGIETRAKANRTTEAAAVLAWLPLWQIRPFYTAEELAPMWPALAIHIGHAKRWPQVVKSAARLGFELGYAGAASFERFGRRFYIVERPHYWRKLIDKAEWQEIDRLISGE